MRRNFQQRNPAQREPHSQQRRPRPWMLHLLSLGLLAGIATTALADDRRDHERARQALLAGEILPLRTVLERIEQTHPGEVLEVELEQESGRWIYEVKLLGRDSGRKKLIIDARNAALLEVEGKAH
jgi:uncharacterized membrane protein YkoI